MCIKTKAKKSVTITITIAIILFSCNSWDNYKVRYKDSIRSVEPPPEYQHSQQDRIRFIISIIKNNQNGRGASIEKVISEATKIGMNRGQAISYIEHLKNNGYAYEPINGEI